MVVGKDFSQVEEDEAEAEDVDEGDDAAESGTEAGCEETKWNLLIWLS